MVAVNDTELIIVAHSFGDMDLVEVPCLARNGMFAMVEHDAGHCYSVTHVPSGLAVYTFPIDEGGLRKAHYLLSCMPPSMDGLPLMPPRDESEMRSISTAGTIAESMMRKIVTDALPMFEAIDREEFVAELTPW